MQKIVIVGGGQAGLSLAAGIRKRDTSVGITMLCGENYPPYQRPPLSKKFLLGELPEERLMLRAPEWYAENNITVKLGVEAESIDRKAQRVRTSDAQTYDYDYLGLTLGSCARMLPDTITHGVENILSVRSIADVQRLKGLMQDAEHLLIVGGGYIGLEAAAVARKLDKKVTMIEASSRILGRVAAEETADFFRNLHQSHGVEILEQARLSNFSIHNRRISGAHLADGRQIDCDLVIVGIGILPHTKLAEQAGLEVNQGIVVDAYGRSSDSKIFSAGDCTCFDFQGQKIRLESVQNATDQADTVAENMLGGDKKYCPIPWFWSDQYDVSLQIVGLNTGYDKVLVREGKKAGSFSHWYFKADTLLAVDAMNDAPSYAAVKKIMELRENITQAQVLDNNSTPKDWLKSMKG